MKTTIVAVIAAAVVVSSARAIDFVSLGALPGDASSWVGGVSADGTVVAGTSSRADGLTRGFRWSSATGIQDIGLGSVATGTSGGAVGVSADGMVLVGWMSVGGGARAVRFTEAGGVHVLGVLTDYEPYQGFPHDYSQSTCVSATGEIICGMSWYSGAGAAKPFLWFLPAGGMSSPNVSLNGSTSYQAHVVSDISSTGGVLVGYNSSIGSFRATVGGTQLLARPNGSASFGASPAQAYGVSGDGGTAVGFGEVDASAGEAFRWTQETKMVSLGQLPGEVRSMAFAANVDGKTIVGRSGDRAFLWTDVAGMVDLQAYAVALGCDLQSWTLREARCVSADGTAVAGIASRDGVVRAFLLTDVPPPPIPCSRMDLNPDGQLNGADLGALLSQWGPATPSVAADMNRDGNVNGIDLAYLLSRWGPCTN